jgi:hypothetical protein
VEVEVEDRLKGGFAVAEEELIPWGRMLERRKARARSWPADQT